MLGVAPITDDQRERMNAMTAMLDNMFNGEAVGAERKHGFVLLHFEFGAADGRCNFISNGADRKDIVVLFKEMIRRFEGQPETKGRA